MPDTQLNLYQKLAKIREMSDVVQKEKQGYKYKYADITDILAKITSGMKKYGISLIPKIVPDSSHVEQHVSTNTKIDKTGKAFDNTVTEMLVSSDMVFCWVNNENPMEVIEVPWFVVGSMGDPSQAFGSALTYCTRYFLCNYFQIALPETDVDSYRSKQKEAEAFEDRAIAEGIINEFDKMLKKYLADNPNDTEKTKKFIGKYAKNANYFAIKESGQAAKLLNDFKDTYMKGEE